MKKRIIKGNQTKVNIYKNANGKYQTMPISTMCTDFKHGEIDKNVLEYDAEFEKEMVDENRK